MRRPTNALKELIDLDAWRQPDMHSLFSLIHRAAEFRVFLEKVENFHPLFASANEVLEIGGGHCWASCIVKAWFPRARVVGTDLSAEALRSLPFWERFLGVALDRSLACPSYEIAVPPQSVDLVFAFASAHHFGRHRRTLQEIARVLRPGGHVLYLHEPACPRFWYPLAYRRANRRGYGVPEDLLLLGKLGELAREAGLEMVVRKDVTTTNRGVVEGLYYRMLSMSGLLQRLLPCSVDIVFRKPNV